MTNLEFLKARMILDSRGNPTVEAAIGLDHHTVTASVPSGASTGSFEAIELRDKDKNNWNGKGVETAINNINEIIFPAVKSMRLTDQEKIDQTLIELDGTENKSKLGANAILAVSLAVARAAAESKQMPLYAYIAELYGGDEPQLLPVPQMNFVNGGAHASNTLDFQEFMIMPIGAGSFSEALRIGSEIFKAIEEDIDATGVGDEGGFSPFFEDGMEGVEVIYEALDLLQRGIEKAGYTPGKDVSIALDPAASEFYANNYYKIGKAYLTPSEMVEFYAKIVRKYPIVSIEDPVGEEDYVGWKGITEALGSQIQLVGDDLFVTNVDRLNKGYEEGLANAILIKPNQIGTLTETLKAITRAREIGYRTIISHRSGDTEDTFIADLAVGVSSGQIKTGCLSRTERVAKYNRLKRIEAILGDSAVYAGKKLLHSFTTVSA